MIDDQAPVVFHFERQPASEPAPRPLPHRTRAWWAVAAGLAVLAVGVAAAAHSPMATGHAAATASKPVGGAVTGIACDVGDRMDIAASTAACRGAQRLADRLPAPGPTADTTTAAPAKAGLAISRSVPAPVRQAAAAPIGAPVAGPTSSLPSAIAALPACNGPVAVAPGADCREPNGTTWSAIVPVGSQPIATQSPLNHWVICREENVPAGKDGC